MCGIFGIINKLGEVSTQLVQQMTNLVSHRGLDGSGYYAKKNLGLGHRRLAIIDTSTDGLQPLKHCSRPIYITYNGEIYNYLEIQKILIKRGHRFKTKTDTEVILNAYVEWGTDCLKYFNGMWAFAILDESKDSLFIARDRFGVKPFYYINTTEAFAFGSEIRQLLPFLSTRQTHSELIQDFLICGLSDQSSTLTFFKEIYKLPASHFAVIELRAINSPLNIQPYYQINNASTMAVLPQESIEIVHQTLGESIRLRLRSDVTVGSCLSGGLDSSTITAIANKYYENENNKFQTITAISESSINSEESYAQLVTSALSTNWIKTKPSYNDFSQVISSIIDIQEEPFGGPSVIMQYYVMQAAKEHNIKVLLDGQGGDELFLGYERYYAAWLKSQWPKSTITDFLSNIVSLKNHNNLSYLALFKHIIGNNNSYIRNFEYRRRSAILKNINTPKEMINFIKNNNNMYNLQKIDITTTNLPMLLRFEDKNSMHFGIETRLPFLDYRLVELALSLPANIKINEGWTKWPIRKIAEKYLPHETAWRRNKLGFAAPNNLWLNQYSNYMDQEIIRANFLHDYLKFKPKKDDLSGIDSNLKWRLFCTASWAHHYSIS
ncbi:MAG: asparagine synthase (glutamine-hydrolyzing) [Thiofilum sp.]|uniref:asparagine synthase (glutamine-hydrolyzing) n=1 Tax=Thiofilum sp. TaxID=2212733 RepID=UPI0025F62BCE|nr:asparagine synthase (glutamine-hydrolyzing) [Thiofilum sp.]MBK8451895.1 asparagine synthase (glutamine-hydrolyzing) [Thiofilum sp.]